jgi:hypothetical protein
VYALHAFNLAEQGPSTHDSTIGGTRHDLGLPDLGQEFGNTDLDALVLRSAKLSVRQVRRPW